MSIISISGPVHTGKSTIIAMLKESLPKDTIFVDDMFLKVWEYFQEVGEFQSYTDVHKDHELLFMYISKVCDFYQEAINQYEDRQELVVFENCYLDYLIYSQLSTWYHYPLIGFQEITLTNLLKSKDKISRIYMTTSDDSNYPTSGVKFECRTTKAAFLRNRGLENQFYNLYRDNRNVVSLPPDIFGNEKLILDDIEANVPMWREVSA